MRSKVVLVVIASAALAMLAALSWAFLRHLPHDSAGWAGWVQAWGSMATILAAIGAVWFTHQLELERARAEDRARAEYDRRAREREDATLVLGLQNLASELRRMNVLAGYQIDEEGNRVLYADVAYEFAAIANLLDRLPVVQLTALGKLDDFLMLRRSAIAISLLYKVPPVPGDGFTRRNRERLTQLQDDCMRCSIRLGEEVKRRDPELYELHKDVIEKL